MRRIILLPMHSKYVRALRAATRTALRVAAWNAALVIAGLMLVALGGEAYFRLTKPFAENSVPRQFVDGVGIIHKPNSQVRYGRWEDGFWVITRTNSQGFIDREPVRPERAAAGCHIAFIGDSFVKAAQAPISDKFHVRLEEIAARELPRLSITTQAYGMGGTGQINQIPFYDEYARHLSPKLIVLVFYFNDFKDNSLALESLTGGLDPDRMPYMSAQRDEYGALKLRPPDAEYARFQLPRPAKRWHESALERLVRVSYFAKWLDTKRPVKRFFGLIRRIDASANPAARIALWANIISAHPCCALLVDDWQPVIQQDRLNAQFSEEYLPPVFEEALEYTAFGIEQFKRRADRDGARLAILTEFNMGTRGHPQFDRLSAIAEARGIPIISQYDYIIRQGYDYRDGRWRNDPHWNATGHQWAAEAVLEWLKANRDVCE